MAAVAVVFSIRPALCQPRSPNTIGRGSSVISITDPPTPPWLPPPPRPEEQMREFSRHDATASASVATLAVDIASEDRKYIARYGDRRPSFWAPPPPPPQLPLPPPPPPPPSVQCRPDPIDRIISDGKGKRRLLWMLLLLLLVGGEKNRGGRCVYPARGKKKKLKGNSHGGSLLPGASVPPPMAEAALFFWVLASREPLRRGRSQQNTESC